MRVFWIFYCWVILAIKTWNRFKSWIQEGNCFIRRSLLKRASHGFQLKLHNFPDSRKINKKIIREIFLIMCQIRFLSGFHKGFHSYRNFTLFYPFSFMAPKNSISNPWFSLLHKRFRIKQLSSYNYGCYYELRQKACERWFCHVIAFAFIMLKNRRISFLVPFFCFKIDHLPIWF